MKIEPKNRAVCGLMAVSHAHSYENSQTKRTKSPSKENVGETPAIEPICCTVVVVG